MQALVGKIARTQLQERMAGMVLEGPELNQLWRLLKEHSSPPHAASAEAEAVNYDDFCQAGEAFSQAVAERAAESFFRASHFLKFPRDEYGRISTLHFFHWVRRKNALMLTRLQLSSYDGSGDGYLTERELEQWAAELIPSLPALSQLRAEFFPFYKVTAVRKFLFFLDSKRRGRVSIRDMLAHPILHELLELRRADITPRELRANWFSLEHAEMLYLECAHNHPTPTHPNPPPPHPTPPPPHPTPPPPRSSRAASDALAHSLTGTTPSHAPPPTPLPAPGTSSSTATRTECSRPPSSPRTAAAASPSPSWRASSRSATPTATATLSRTRSTTSRT